MTIFWALQLTKIADLLTIIMETDAKICFDALNLGLLNFEWSTSVPLNNVVEISRCFDCCAFCLLILFVFFFFFFPLSLSS